MNARTIIANYCVLHDPSGQGHAWRLVDAENISADIAEELACWIIEDEPREGDEYTASNGQHYCLPGK